MFTVLADDADKAALYRRMEAEGLLGCAMYPIKPSLSAFLESCRTGVVVAGFADGEMTGFALFSPWMGRTWRFDFTVFRAWFRHAPAMARAVLRWFFEHYAADAVVGITPETNRHAWHIAKDAGFTMLGTIPGACYLERRHTYVAGMLVVATPETVEDAMGFGVGGASAPTPVVQQTPKAETTKDVTAASTEARQSQKDKAAKAAGLKNTVLSDALTASATTAGNVKTLLGQ